MTDALPNTRWSPGWRRSLRSFLGIPTLVALACGCGASHQRPSAIVVTASGRVGALQIDRSNQQDVIALAGKPDAQRRGHVSGSTPYRALGYGCTRHAAGDREQLVAGGPYCRTVFFLNARTGRLETFFTTSPRYSAAHGVRVGMSTARAERLLHRIVHEGCETNLYLASRAASLTIAFEGGHVNLPNTRLIGGGVYAFVLHGRKSDAGVFDCL